MENLLMIKLNETAIIREVKHPNKEMQRRLLDLGFYPNTSIRKVLISPKGDPVAYLLRGTTVALRSADAQYIQVEREKS